jgi:hypothetical protein
LLDAAYDIYCIAHGTGTVRGVEERERVEATDFDLAQAN